MIHLIARLFAIKLVRDRFKAKKGQPPGRLPPRPTPTPAPIESQRSDASSEPDSPLEMPVPAWKETAKRTLKEIKSDRVTLIAAGMAYYLFLAIFPALIAFAGILGLAEIDTAPIIDAIEKNLPGESAALLVQAVEGSQETSESTALGATLFGIALALWSATSGFIALQKGLNVAYDVPEDRKFVSARGVALALVVATGLLGGVPSPIFFFGDGTFFDVLGWSLTIVAVILLFSVFYYLGPKRESPRWQWLSVGAVVGGLIWITSSYAFRIYAGTPDRYADTYGSIGAVIALIFWLYLTSISILVGGELNAELERQADKRKAANSA